MNFERVANIKKSLIREMFEKANEHSVNLGLGMPFLKTTDLVKMRAIEAIRNDQTFYTPNQGLKVLREEVAKKHSKETGLKISGENVLITNGATQAIFTLMFSLLNPGDEILIPDPGYPLYEAIAKMLRCKVKRYTLFWEKDFDIDVDEISRKISDKTALIVLNSPNNPTGTVFKEETLKHFAFLLESRNISVLSDEIYKGLSYEGVAMSISSFLPLEKVYVISGVSKEYSMSGWRIGWIISSRQNISQVLKAHMYTVSCISGINQIAATAALKLGDRGVRNAMRFNRDLALRELDKVPLIKYKKPVGGIYIFVNVSAYGDGKEIADALLKRENVITIPGIAFGEQGRDFIRISFGVDPETLKKGLNSIRRFFSYVEV